MSLIISKARKIDTVRMLRPVLAIVMIAPLAACGDGGVNSVSGSIVQGPPPPPPPPPIGPLGVTVDTAFTAFGIVSEIRWSAVDGSYSVDFTDGGTSAFGTGDEVPWGLNIYPKVNNGTGVVIRKDSDFTYSNLAAVFDNGWGGIQGYFAFGIPSSAADIPVTGEATYTAKVFGGDERLSDTSLTYLAKGTASLSFDFGAGSLSGHFDPILELQWENEGERALGRYTFANTVFAAGRTDFSGALKHDGHSTMGAFNGAFTGPQASELIAQWSVPYLNPFTNAQGTLTGVWLGKKGD